MRRRSKNKNAPVPETCTRCFEPFGEGPKCADCGVHKGRLIRRLAGPKRKTLS